MDMERKSIRVELKEESPGDFVARIAQLDIMDKDADVILPGAFPEGKDVLVSAYQHGSWMGELNVGRAVVKEDGEFALGEGQFYLTTGTGKEHYETVKLNGELQEWSFGFKVLEQADDNEVDAWAKAHDGARPMRIIKKLDPFEISPVMKGAGIGTATIAIKNDVDGLPYAEQAATVLAAVRGLTERTRSLADLRRKEGRDLSQSNRDKMKELLKGLSEAELELKDLVDNIEPVDKALAEKLMSEFIKLNFEITEVTIK